MQPIDQLKKLNFLSWPMLLIGLERGWASKSDISNFATSFLIENENFNDEDILSLTFSDYLEDLEIKELILKFNHLNEDCYIESMEKWRLALLIELNESNQSKEDKFNKLQELYAIFDYPVDMALCSAYSQDFSVSPLDALKNVISSLKLKYSNILDC